MAGGEMTGRYLAQLRLLLGAKRRRLIAARVETAAGRRLHRARHIALEHYALGVAPRLRVGYRDGRYKAFAVRVLTVEDQLKTFRQLHQLAEIHDAYTV